VSAQNLVAHKLDLTVALEILNALVHYLFNFCRVF